MLLAIDVGNTETVIGLFSLGPDDEPPAHSRPASSEPPEPAGMTHHWRLSTVDDRTPDEHALLLSNLLELSRLQFEDVVSGMAVTSSVPLVKTSLRQMAEDVYKRQLCTPTALCTLTALCTTTLPAR